MEGDDQLFKELLHSFFADFFELFYPEVAARLDFREVDFLDKEVFTDIPTGQQREADVAAQVRTREGDPEILLIHVEVQGRRRADFSARMNEYYSLLRLRRNVPVLPVALFTSPVGEGLGWHEHEEGLFGEWTHRFRYRIVSPADLPAASFRERPNPLAPAIAAMMKPGGESRPLHKALCLVGVARAETDDARRALLAHLVERSLELSENEAEEFGRLVQTEPLREVRAMVNVYEERGRLKGLDQGRVEGRAEERLEARREMVLHLARQTYSSVPESLQVEILSATEVAELDRLYDSLLGQWTPPGSSRR